MTILANLDSLVEAIIKGMTHGGCDGSYMREQSPILGSVAWKVKDPSLGQPIEGTVQTTGDAREVNAYCSKLQGIHAILLAISAIVPSTTKWKAPSQSDVTTKGVLLARTGIGSR
jgi:hypothetical protein